ncbi:phosphoglycolate phosphatase [Acetitomaculum ruminis DSM 5522]|uniref:Phosphoglycolate phosphatase n=1 Tax=Acetitomaculum ruminis DSM 5522 TaxID=1120918 RepID=A0A1I0XN58_9FIRM|nr:HAD hydrolase-like protein [Acetitomaculum ruminis]SFB02402.1 phosphoglycolate phosphatase [Acetitomaculum ruminis DSM 5522]
MVKYIMFDLDGTLTDSREGIINSIIYALEYFGIKAPGDRSLLECFIGPPLDYSFQKHYGFSEEKSWEAVEIYRKRYDPIGKFENKPYEGIEELLKILKKNGKKLIVASSKPHQMCIDIIEHFGLDKYFDHIQGGADKGQLHSKTGVMKEALNVMNITEEKKKETVMVGDTMFDIEGAKALNLKSIGVCYGFGSKKELEEHGADFIVKDIEQLKKVLLS